MSANLNRISRRRLLKAAMFTGATAGLAACGGGARPAAPAGEAPPPTEAPPAAEAPQESPAAEAPAGAERILYLNMPSFYGDPGAGTDPGCSGGANTVFTNQLMFSSLVYLNEKMEPTSDCAESWTPNEDSSVWTFKLRKDLKWSDGTPITAKDFEWTIKRNVSPDISCGGGILYMMDIIKGAADFAGKVTTDPDTIGVKALDDYTLQFELTGPAGFFPIMVSYPTYAPLPKDRIEQYGKDTQWTQPQYVLSNGPFKMTEWKRDEYMTLLPNEHWHGYTEQPPGLDKLTVRMLKNQATAIAAYETGELDVIEVPTGDLPRVKNDPVLSQQLITYAELFTQYMLIPVSAKPFDDVRVRQALAIAIDRDAIADVLAGTVTPAYQFLPPTMLGYDKDLNPEMAYNPDKARQLLADAGFPNGEGFPKFWINSNHTDDYQTMFEAISAMYKDVLGIEMELALMDPGARGAWREQEPRRLHLWRERWGMDFPDSHNSMNFMVTGRLKGDYSKIPEWGGYKSTDRVAPLVEEAARSADPARRHELYRQADRILTWEDPYLIPIYYYVANLMMKPRVKGVYVTGMGPTYRRVSVES